MKPGGSDTRRILVIDDNAAIHEDFRKTLITQGQNEELEAAERALFAEDPVTVAPGKPTFEVDCALQGQEGWKMAQKAILEKRPYHMAFVDMRMPPGWDGMETIRHLFELDADIQAVVCTAYSDYSWEHMFQKLGMTDRVLILKKPFDPMEVCQLAAALTEKWKLKRQAELKLTELQAMVHARTHELHEQSLRDRLTGLPNRAYLMEKLGPIVSAQSGRRGSVFALMFLDFDRFKTVNDSLGHEVGDQLLVEIAGRLQGFIHAWSGAGNGGGGSFASRLGGDEFVVLLDQVESPANAVQFSQELLRTLAVPYNIGGHEVHSQASIGVTTGELFYTRAKEALRDADTAMYRAKATGKGRCVLFDRSMHEHAMARLTLETDLRRGIDRQEFDIVYQPIVSLTTGMVAGFESLVRWNHPKRGLVMPGEFIPLSEETNLIVPLGQWILRRVCRQLAEWRLTHSPMHPVPVSVNLSRKQFGDPELLPLITGLMKEHRLPPEALTLEITESAIMEASDPAEELLQQLRDLHVKIYMDDFGTGYSSLNCLHRMPLSCLKIDRSFIFTMTGRRDYAAVIHAIIQLAHNLGIQVVAEGVETREQVSMLQSLDCDMAQGFYFSVPLDQARAADVMRLGRCNRTHGKQAEAGVGV